MTYCDAIAERQTANWRMGGNLYEQKSAKHDQNRTKQLQTSAFLHSGIQHNFNIWETNFCNLLLLLKHKIRNISIFVYAAFLFMIWQNIFIKFYLLLIDNLFIFEWNL